MLKIWKPQNVQATFAAAIVLMTLISVLATTPVSAETAIVAEQPTVDAPGKKKVEAQIVKLAEGSVLLPVPGDWKPVKPRSNIIRYEFSIPAVKGDETPGRMTITAAGGGVEANIARWAGQFQTSAGKPLGDGAKKVEEKNVGGLKVHVIDLTGDFQDSPRGPFGPKVSRPSYRMLAVIIPLKKGGTWFIKSYGPQATMKRAEKDFAAMVEGLKHLP